jgi:hypothetical protein
MSVHMVGSRPILESTGARSNGAPAPAFGLANISDRAAFAARKRMLPASNPQVICRTVSEGAVLFSVADEVYFGLNAVGVRVWTLLNEVRSLNQLVAVLSSEYPEVRPAQIHSDVVELLDDLTSKGLVIARVEPEPEEDGIADPDSQGDASGAERVA